MVIRIGSLLFYPDIPIYALYYERGVNVEHLRSFSTRKNAVQKVDIASRIGTYVNLEPGSSENSPVC